MSSSSSASVNNNDNNEDTWIAIIITSVVVTGIVCLLFGFLAGSIWTSWRMSLGFRHNLLFWFIDRLGVIKCPDKVHLMSEEQVLKYIRSMRRMTKRPFSTLSKNSDGIQLREREIIGRDGMIIPALIYLPIASTQASSSNNQQSYPVIIFFHGGAFITGSPGIADYLCRLFCKLSNSIVIVPDYRLAPEHKFPCAHNDAEDTLIWVYEQAHKDLPTDPNRIALIGDSAGGNLAAATSIFAAKNNIPIRFCIPIYPMMTHVSSLIPVGLDVGNPSFSTPPNSFSELDHFGHRRNDFKSSIMRNFNAPIVRPIDLFWASSLYLKGENDAWDIRASPLLASLEDLKSVAPTMVITASHDSLADEGIAYFKKVLLAGVHAVHYHGNKKCHGFLAMEGIAYNPELRKLLTGFIHKHFS